MRSISSTTHAARHTFQARARSSASVMLAAAAACAGPALCATSSARADQVIGNWENANDGWIDWGSGQVLVDQSPKFSYVTGTGVTLGNTALQVTQNGWNQNLAIKLQDAQGDLRDEFFEYTQVAIDVAVPAQTTTGFTEVFQMWLNAQNYGFVGLSPTTPVRQFGWGATGGESQTATLTLDYSNAFDGDVNNGEVFSNPVDNWVEFILATNGSDLQHGTMIFDNARLTSPRLAVDVNGGSTPGTLRPSQRGFRRWDNLPTSGQNGDPAQNGYPTGTATLAFNTSIVASGSVQATLASRDVGGATPTYLPGANLNSHDMSIPGRDLDESGNFTPARDSIYRDRVIAETAIGSNGTNHRMEITLDGLDPNTAYKVKFYAYDNANPQSVNVFTDVTAQPLIFMPSGNSSDGNFSPGDGSGGTQYAPAGQYIDGTAAPTFPATNDFRAIELYATSDGTGKLVFAQTTITGLAGTTQVLPVLNGFEIEADQRSWQGGAGTSWNSAGNWIGGLVPQTKGQVANFGNTANTSVTIDSPTTLARMNFSGSAMTIGGAGTLTLDDNSINSTLSGGAVTGRTEINLTGTSAAQTISAPLVLAKDTQVWTSTAAQTLTLTDLQPSAVVLSKAGAGTLQVNRLEVNRLAVNSGTVQVLESLPDYGSGFPSGDNASVSVVSSLSVANGAVLDLTNNDLIVDYDGASLATTIEALVRSAYNVIGDWQGDGITSSIAAADGSYTLAVADNVALAAPFGSAAGGPLFSGVDVDLTSVLVKFTHRVDVNLDGLITPDDAASFGTNYDESITSGFTWAMGDMDYDGACTPTDAAIFGTFYDESLASLPEPASLAAFGLLGLALARRRRRG